MKFAVKVHNKYLSEAVQKLAFDNGYKWQGYERGYLMKNSGKEIGFNLDNDGDMTSGNSESYDPVYFDALTDWQKIEEAMKPKEPLIVYAHCCDNHTQIKGRFYIGIHGDKESADGHHRCPDCKTIRFQEVIE